MFKLLFGWWTKWYNPEHPVKQFCYFCHAEIDDVKNAAVGEATKPGKEPRRVLAHRDCVWENDLFKELSKGDENDKGNVQPANG